MKLISVPAERCSDVAGLLTLLSENSSFDFAGALKSLPWIVFENSDPAVLNEWKRTLEPENAALQIDPTTRSPRSKKKQAPTLQNRSAALPLILPTKIETAARTLGKSISDASIRLHWCETFLFAFQLVEAFYKQDASGRVLFSDLIYQTQQELQEVIEDYNSYYKNHEGEFAAVIDKLRASILSKEEEIQEVRRHIRSRL